MQFYEVLNIQAYLFMPYYEHFNVAAPVYLTHL